MGAVGVLHVCDKFGVAGSSIHGVSRLFSWWFPRYDAARFAVSLVRPQGARAGLPAPGGAGHPGAPPRARPLRPAHPARPRGAGARPERARPARPRLRRRGLRPPGRAPRGRRAGAARALRGPAHARLPGRWPTGCSPASRDRAIAVSASTRDFLVRQRHVPAARVPLDLERRAARRVRPRREPSGARGARRAGHRRGGAGGRQRWRASASRRGTATCWTRRPASSRARPDARFLLVGRRRPGAGAARARPRALGIAAARRVRRPPRRHPGRAGRHRRALHLLDLRGNAAYPVRGHGRRQGHRLHCGGWLPRGAGGRRDRPAGPAARRRRRWPTALLRVLGDPDAARARSRRPRARPRAATTSRACVRQMEALYDEVLAESPRHALRRLARHARRPGRSRATCCCGRYPPFVTGGPLPQGHVPVFVFHSLEPESLRPQAALPGRQRLRDALGGRVLPRPVGARRRPERAVLLTFDDGRGSLCSVGLPLLRRYGMRGIVFLVPGRMRSRPGPLPPTWDDVGGGGVPRSAVLAREPGRRHVPVLGGDGRARRARASSTSRATR